MYILGMDTQNNDQKELEMRLRLRDDFEFYALNCLKIRTKEGEIKPFVLNRAQKYILSKVNEQLRTRGYVRIIIDKGRQQGCTTLIQGLGYQAVTHRRGLRAFILTHEEEATNNLFEMAKRYHELCPPFVKPTTQASNAKELIFGGLDSGYKLGTAGNKSVGRSSTIQFLHASEAAFYKHADEHAKGILQTVPLAKGTFVFIESTANGVGNWYHQQWQKAESGESDFEPCFVPWYWQDEYRREVPKDFNLEDEEIDLKHLYGLTDEQLCWRRMKIVELSVNGSDGAKSFKQEYPNNATESFQLSGEDTFFPPDLVMQARKGVAEKYGPLIIGVDPARFGDDRTAIIRRQGRVAFNLQTYCKKDTMEVTGIVNAIIRDEKPVRVFVDVGGLGAGIIDRLYELGHKDVVRPVNSATSALDDNKYGNKRAEMWALGRDWMLDAPCQIPDEDSLHADLCGAKYKGDSKSRLLIESKRDMKDRGIRSSDEADALLLTFAFPVRMDELNKSKTDAEKAKIIMGGRQKAIKLRQQSYAR
jgi:hypothetical protein